MISIHDTLRVKPIHPIYAAGPGRMRVGAQADLTVEIEDDDDQKFITLCRLLDGSRSVGEVVRTMQARFKGLDEDELLEVIEGLDQERLIESAARSDYDDPAHPKHRYLSNVNYFSVYADSESQRGDIQDQLLDAKVLLLGLGAGGSHILSQLASIGIGKIRAVDYDKVELTNLNRQILYSEADVGALKTTASLQRIKAYNSHIDIEVVSRKIVNEADLRDLMDGMDLVICAIDEPPFQAQIIVNTVAIEKKIPCIYGMSQITSGRFFTVLPHESGCMGCLVVHYTQNDPQFVDQFIAFQELNFKNPTLSFAPDVARLCGMIASEAVRVLTGYLPPMGIGKQIELCFETNETQTLTQWPRHPRLCPVCGNGRHDDWTVFKYLRDKRAAEGTL